MAEEADKLKKHLDLLRQEYVKLQQRLAEVEKKYNIVTAGAAGPDDDNFISRLLRTVADLFDKDLYSDLTIAVDGKEVKAHRFVLGARSNNWGVADLADVQSLDFTGIPYDVAMTLLKWVYTDQVELQSDDSFILQLMSAASTYELDVLRDRCEKALMSSVTVRNCIRFYQTAEQIGASSLKTYCSELISNHWNDFTSDDFVSMTAPLLYKMFKAKTTFPLHTAIRHRREDVVFLYLIEFDALLPDKLDEVDENGDLPLDLALSSKQESVASELIKHKVNVNRMDSKGCCLLHKALTRGDEFSATFLIQNGAKLNIVSQLELETPLHVVSSYNPSLTVSEVLAGMLNVATLLLEKGCHINLQDKLGNSALHRSITSKNKDVFNLLLSNRQLNLDLRNVQGETPLWLALDTSDDYGEDSFAGKLITRGCSPDAVNPSTGSTLLHLAAQAKNEAACLFLATHGASSSIANNQGEVPLHIASKQGLSNLAALLLKKGANPNAQTLEDVSSRVEGLSLEGDRSDLLHASKQTPLHMAITYQHADVVNVFLEHRAAAMDSQDGLLIIPDFNIYDSNEQTVLGLALWTGLHNFAAQLLGGGASINHITSEGTTLLHSAILQQDTKSALFLLEHQAKLNIKTKAGETPLQLAIRRHLPVVVDALCVRGANMNTPDDDGNPPLWMALETGQEDVASTLVRHGCDTTSWGKGPEGCQQTLLHRAIDENNEAVACFLIRSQCDVNSPRRPGPNGEGADVCADGQGPLHQACQWGLEEVVQCLVEFQVDVNAKDADGQTPLHIAISNQHPIIIGLLMSHPLLDLTLRDKSGLTPFAAAMTHKNNKAAQAILDREPRAAEQVDNKGRNFLHVAVQQSDIESVLFLISIRANVNSRVQDHSAYSPLQLAVLAGSEIIVRNLLLAGAQVNDLNSNKQTSLHMACEADQPSLCSVLIDNGINVDALDLQGNNALHTAVYHGNLNCIRILLTESSINAEAVNLKSQTPMHILGQYGRDNAAAIFDLFKECMPAYPVEKQNADGNTVLMLAYQNGNSGLCRTIVRSGASLGTLNKQGQSIFNVPVATKQLLFRMLDMLSKEPTWSESEVCQECQAKFGIKTRKHHCRHCGRVLCAKCSSKMVPIVKYELTKPVRVCDVCFDVISLGGVS
ncbi:rabankyrin-5-like isoform X2 [Anneissia japonica]|uniref:rabankyrin-5-like isoform X2 n=1 Tax=Anneissia japonica TaxID=1529436 RepID=UPI0014256904|nr:rabankyrin-5-like isoform X2 [Anneissia japonica]